MVDKRSALRRTTNVLTGYDCFRNPCGKGNCGKTAGGSHGIHNDEWRFAVSDGQIAIELTVSSGRYPATVPPDVVASYTDHMRMPHGTMLHQHVAFRTSREEIRDNSRGNNCTLVDGGTCWGAWGSGLEAEKFDPLLSSTPEQSESFWLKLEEEWSLRAAEVTSAEKYERCVHCDATGTVLKA